MNGRRLLILATTIALCCRGQVGAVPSFSGAEGFGATTRGGAGGSVIHVTNLNDSGTGSLRAALQASGPRTIVFDVAGVVQLQSELVVTSPFVTIAGESAPGDGITVVGETVSMDTHDIIVRYMRFRRGTTAREDDSFGPDRTPGNIMIDHVSASWGYDENISIYRNKNAVGNVIPTHNVTIQWSISSEGLNEPSADHPFGHAFGSTLGGKGVNFHHNLWASNTGRNPSLSFSHFIDFRNNVIFNWQHRTMDGAGPEAHVNVINNYYQPGPASGKANNATEDPIPNLRVLIAEPEIRDGVFPGGVGWWYVDGNVVEGYPEVTADNWEGESEVAPGVFATGVQFEQPFPVEWARVLAPHVDLSNPGPYPFSPDPRDPYDAVIPALPTIATQSAEDARQWVLDYAGARLPVRDVVDSRVIGTVLSGNPTAGPDGDGIVHTIADVGGYPMIPFVQRDGDWDTDGDGMPNFWEQEHGLNVSNAADRLDDFDADGYDNLEDYLNEAGAFPAVQDIVWDNSLANDRYARIENWDIAFQPSKFDTARIHNGTVTVDAVGQHAGTLRVAPSAGNNATLNISSGWLKVADALEIAAAGANGAVNLSGTGKLRVGTLAKGPNGAFNLTGGTLSADAVAFSLENNGGTIAPGDSAGTTHIMGDLTINSGALEIELSGAHPNEFDSLVVDGIADVGGMLSVTLIDSFQPRAGDVFQILAAGDLIGTFAEDLPPLLGLLEWDVAYDYEGNSISLAVDTPFTSDFDGDGDVDSTDLDLWESAYGTTGVGDADSDGDTDGSDFLLWQQQFTGDLSSLAAATVVPEPRSVALFAALIAMTFATCRSEKR